MDTTTTSTYWCLPIVITSENVAGELHLDWKTVREPEKQCLREKLRRAGNPGSLKQNIKMYSL